MKLPEFDKPFWIPNLEEVNDPNAGKSATKKKFKFNKNRRRMIKQSRRKNR